MLALHLLVWRHPYGSSATQTCLNKEQFSSSNSDFQGGSRIAKWGGSVGTAPLSQPDSRLVGRMGGRMSPPPGLHPHCTSRRCPLRTETVQTRQAAPNSYSPLRREQSSFARSPPVALQRILVAPSDF